jgi:hypothetical protein
VGRNATGGARSDGAGAGESDWWGVGSGAFRGRIVSVLLQYSLNAIQSPGATEQAAQGANAELDLEAQSHNAPPQFVDRFAAWWRNVKQYSCEPFYANLATAVLAMVWAACHHGDVSGGFNMGSFFRDWLIGDRPGISMDSRLGSEV